jgi:two-component system LytT family response regulator
VKKVYRAVIVDDEAPARAKVARLLDKDGRFEVVGQAADGADAVARIETLEPDLAIVDVQMPALTGFEVIAALGPRRCPKIIFATAHDRFAVQAFEANAVDYLLKPFDAARFRVALDKAWAQLRAGTSDADALEALAAGYPSARGPYLERLLVKRKGSWVPVPLAKVRRLSADDKYVRAFSEQGEDLLRETLSVLERRLDPQKFVRVHRSDIVNLAYVARLDTLFHGDGLLTLDDGSTVSVSRNLREGFFARWSGG